MDGPINYNIDVKNPFQEYVKGLQLGAAAKQIQAQQAQEIQMQADIQDLSKNPTADGILKTMLKYPSLKEAYAPAYNALSAKDQQAMINKISPVFYALQSGNNAAALGAVQQQIDAAKNSGMEKDAADAQRIFDMIKTDPNRAKLETGAAFAATAPDQYNKVAESLRQEAIAPYQQQKAVADASKAQTDAFYANDKNFMDIANTQNQINVRNQGQVTNEQRLALQQQVGNSTIDKNTASINTAQANLAKIQAEQARAKADEKIQGQQALAQSQSAIEVFDKLTAMADKQPGLSLFGGAGNTTGGVMGRIPDILPKTIEFQSLLDLAKDKVFLNNISLMTGKGAISDAEGKALKNALVNLSSTQSSKVLSENFKIAKNYLTKMQAGIKERYGITEEATSPTATNKLVFVRGPDGKIIQQPAGAK